MFPFSHPTFLHPSYWGSLLKLNFGSWSPFQLQKLLLSLLLACVNRCDYEAEPIINFTKPSYLFNIRLYWYRGSWTKVAIPSQNHVYSIQIEGTYTYRIKINICCGSEKELECLHVCFYPGQPHQSRYSSSWSFKVRSSCSASIDCRSTPAVPKADFAPASRVAQDHALLWSVSVDMVVTTNPKKDVSGPKWAANQGHFRVKFLHKIHFPATEFVVRVKSCQPLN